MPVKADVTIEWKPTGRNGRGIVTARTSTGASIFTSSIDATNPDDRERFLNEVCRRHRKTDRAKAMAALEEIAASCMGGDEADQAKVGLSQMVAKQVEGSEFFHHGEAAYVTVQVSDGDGKHHNETYPVGSTQFQRLLQARFFKSFGRPATSGGVQDAIGALSGKAIHYGPEKKTFVRVAEHGGAVYIDLVDEGWRVVRVTSRGWSIITDPPVKFLRKKGMMALPTPVRGGSVDLLRPLINAKDDRNWRLIVAWLLGALHPRGPYPILVINGEQGSAKSTLARMLRKIIDPNLAELRSMPRDEKDLILMAGNSWICGFDNLSGMTQATADCLCRLSTGGGYGTRQLYSDDSEMIWDVKRPLILNGIEEDATKADVLDRALRLSLPTIDEKGRLTEEEIWAEFEQIAPEVLGALLDGVVGALANASTVKLTFKPRMLDFTKWTVAAEPNLGWPEGTFVEAYKSNRGDSSAEALEQSSIGEPIIMLIERCPLGTWKGSATMLLDAIEGFADERTKRRDDWPKSGPKLAAKLRRFAPVLRKNGVDAVLGERNRTSRPWILTKIPEAAPVTVTPVTPVTPTNPPLEEDLPF